MISWYGTRRKPFAKRWWEKKPKAGDSQGVDIHELADITRYHRGDPRRLPPFELRLKRTDHLWEKVTNPIARSVLHTVWRMLPPDTVFGPTFDNPDKCPPELFEYQERINEALGKSGLAKALAGGEAMLPDPTAHLPWPWKYLARKYGPKNLQQLTRLVVNNLEWYVDQSVKLKDPWTIIAEQLPINLALTAMVMLAFVTATSINTAHWVALIGLTLGGAGLILAMQLIWGRETHKQKTNLAEFYHYLMREYSDTEEDPDEDPEKYRLRLRGKNSA